MTDHKKLLIASILLLALQGCVTFPTYHCQWDEKIYMNMKTGWHYPDVWVCNPEKAK